MSLKKYCEKHSYSYQAIINKITGLDEEQAQRIIQTFFKAKPKQKRGSYKIQE